MTFRFSRLLLVAVAVVSLSFVTGCKPDLTNDQALSLIQTHYDQTAAIPLIIHIDHTSLQSGVLAKYWSLSKVSPENKLWGDFTLTDAGKKLFKLPNGKDVIEWREDTSGKYQYDVITTTALKLKARDVKEIRDEVVPGVKGPGKVVVFKEAFDITVLPDALQSLILGNTNNKLAREKQADLTLENGAWAFHAIEQ
jgi:hypothetical protein